MAKIHLDCRKLCEGTGPRKEDWGWRWYQGGCNGGQLGDCLRQFLHQSLAEAFHVNFMLVYKKYYSFLYLDEVLKSTYSFVFPLHEWYQVKTVFMYSLQNKHWHKKIFEYNWPQTSQKMDSLMIKSDVYLTTLFIHHHDHIPYTVNFLSVRNS